jgi:predicted GNAT family N-acyltransferase
VIRIREYRPDTEEYAQELRLREAVLRTPLGIPLSRRDTANDTERLHIGAFDREKLVGLVLLWPREGQEIQILQMAVAEGYRGQGVGTKLMAVAESRCWSLDAQRITLNARAPVVGFYEKRGFRRCSDEFSSVGIPHVQMELRRGS